MVPIPFTLRVASRDYSTEKFTAWSTDKVNGLLHFDDDSVTIEWAGTASIDEVQGLEVHSQTVPIPPEVLTISLPRLRTAKLAGGWWRPRLELTGNDLQVLAQVPGQSAGRVQLWIARRDRSRAAGLVEALHRAARQWLERKPPALGLAILIVLSMPACHPRPRASEPFPGYTHIHAGPECPPADGHSVSLVFRPQPDSFDAMGPQLRIAVWREIGSLPGRTFASADRPGTGGGYECAGSATCSPLRDWRIRFEPLGRDSSLAGELSVLGDRGPDPERALSGTLAVTHRVLHLALNLEDQDRS